ncbi:MAG: helix-turn-helix domain-containing protein [Planctomycetes bacterium]|nr:helix-turn-helix domain-containing protein [Planctomycetota bacterium]
MTNQDSEQPTNHQWLRRMADLEDSCGSISVGGLAQDLGMLKARRETNVVARTAFGKLLELARRRAGLGVEELAAQAATEVADIIQLERGDNVDLAPRVVFQLCAVLHLPHTGVMELAGLTGHREGIVAEAAVRFAAQSEGIEKLTAEERNALQEFEKVLAKATGQK